MLKVDQLSYSFQGESLLNNVSFTAQSGEVIGVVGPKMAGKSLFLRLMSGWIKPTSGQIVLNNRDVWRERKRLRRYISYVPSHHPFEPDTKVVEVLNLAWQLYPHDTSREKWQEVLSVWELAPLLQRSLHQLNAFDVNRLLFCFVHFQRPQVLLLDEPASDCDPWYRAVLMKQLFAHLDKPLCLMVTHDLHMVQQWASRLFILNRGYLSHDRPIQGSMKRHLFGFIERQIIGVTDESTSADDSP